MRRSAVSGSFYPSSPSLLSAMAMRLLQDAQGQVEKKERLALVCPHAGYAYSGKTAALSFSSCANFSRNDITAVIIGPNHTGLGTPISVSFDDWRTPLGEAKCDAELAGEIVKEGKIARRDELAHSSEHSCEVQLPFLQCACPKARIVCICMGYQDSDSAGDLGQAIRKAAKKLKRDVIVIASSDFTHFEPAKSAEAKDKSAIRKLLGLDWKGFEKEVESRNLSVCGHGPIAAAMHYAILCGAKKCELLSYTNSGEETGDFSSVVAYASLAISK